LSGWFGVAWHDAQPPAKNIVLPLSRLGVCGASALAGTLTGLVSTQNTATPAKANITARTTNLRSIAKSSAVQS
jgi:hypothetical protein